MLPGRIGRFKLLPSVMAGDPRGASNSTPNTYGPFGNYSKSQRALPPREFQVAGARRSCSEPFGPTTAPPNEAADSRDARFPP
jgi:hypothetical protein